MSSKVEEGGGQKLGPTQDILRYLKHVAFQNKFSLTMDPFTCSECQSFCKANNNVLFRPPEIIWCQQATSSTTGKCIDRFVLTYRTTSHAITGYSPPFLLMGRRIRCRLDFMKPGIVKGKQQGWSKVQNCNNFRVQEGR